MLDTTAWSNELTRRVDEVVAHYELDKLVAEKNKRLRRRRQNKTFTRAQRAIRWHANKLIELLPESGASSRKVLNRLISHADATIQFVEDDSRSRWHRPPPQTCLIRAARRLFGEFRNELGDYYVPFVKKVARRAGIKRLTKSTGPDGLQPPETWPAGRSSPASLRSWSWTNSTRTAIPKLRASSSRPSQE